MHVVTAEEMRKLDEYVIREIGIPAVVLMENAGSAIAREVVAYSRNAGWERPDRPPRWLILAGKGNNGGDGLVAARHLTEQGYQVTIVYAVPAKGLVGDAAFQRDVAERLQIPVMVYGAAPIEWSAYDGIVDALLGTGSSGAPRGAYAALIREANASGLPIIAADIPSGLDPDTGMIHDPCIRAVRTVALAFLKRGLVQPPGAEAAGVVSVAPIGIWPSLAESFGVRTFLLGEAVMRQRLGVDPALARRMDTHKGTYGHVLVCAGSKRMSGAGLLCAKAALRAGCGLVTWAVPDGLLPHLIGQLPEAMLAALPGEEHNRHTLPVLVELANSRDAAVAGPGLGRFDGDAEWLRGLWEQVDCPLVLDADALNMLADAGDVSAWPRRQAPVILTPHPGEMARLAKVSTAAVQRDRIGIALAYARRHGVTLVLKGARTVVATPEGTVYVNPTGNPGMATGGAGDVLAGIIGSLLAQGLTAEQAACLGVWLHGAAGDRAAANRQGPYSLLAGDIIEAL